MLDLPAARHLLHHQLGVHPTPRPRWRPAWPPPPGRRSARGTRRRCWWPARSPACSRPAPSSGRPTTPPSRIPQAPGCRATRRPPRRSPSLVAVLHPQQNCAALRAAQHLVIGGGGDSGELTRGRSRSGMLRTDGPVAVPAPGATVRPLAFVQRHQIGIQSRGQFVTARDTLVPGLLDRRERIVARPLGVRQLALQRVDAGEFACLLSSAAPRGAPSPRAVNPPGWTGDVATSRVRAAGRRAAWR